MNNNVVAIESNKGPEFQGKNLWCQNKTLEGINIRGIVGPQML